MSALQNLHKFSPEFYQFSEYWWRIPLIRLIKFVLERERQKKRTWLFFLTSFDDVKLISWHRVNSSKLWGWLKWQKYVLTALTTTINMKLSSKILRGAFRPYLFSYMPFLLRREKIPQYCDGRAKKSFPGSISYSSSSWKHMQKSFHKSLVDGWIIHQRHSKALFCHHPSFLVSLVWQFG